MRTATEQYLECQDCGKPIGPPLTEAQKQRIAWNPYNYVAWCPECWRGNGYGR